MCGYTVPFGDITMKNFTLLINPCTGLGTTKGTYMYVSIEVTQNNNLGGGGVRLRPPNGLGTL